jgi:hypothetical protein
MTEAITEVGQCKFVVKECSVPCGPPLFVLEPNGKQISLLRDASLGFNLREGTTLQRAHDIARCLNTEIASRSALCSSLIDW